jgi:5-(carboxyamino)imidazole ribonucleotide synthase
MSKVWVLGSGQLGAMLRHAGTPIGIDVRPIDASDDLSALSDLSDQDFITPEIEAWAHSETTDRLAAHANFINRDVFPIIADRFTQKQTLDQLGVATAPWQAVGVETTEQELRAKLGDRILLKRRRGGYDGRGQHWIKTSDATIPNDFRDESIAEQAIDFSDEVSVIGVRSRSGQTRFYPLSQNHHVNGILKATIGGAPKFMHLQSTAEAMLTKVLEHFNYVGVMAMECFVVKDESGNQQLLVNELAPRVHNSGHWTQAGMSISQFESHVRAVADLPLGKPTFDAVTVMFNLVGTPFDQRWLDIRGAQVYWYQKDVREGRKLGHINLLATSKNSLCDLAETLPDDESVFHWLMCELGYSCD